MAHPSKPRAPGHYGRIGKGREIALAVTHRPDLDLNFYGPHCGAYTITRPREILVKTTPPYNGATKPLRNRYEGPRVIRVWPAYRKARYLFSSHIVAPGPCFRILTFARRVHSQIFEGGIDAPHLASEWVIGIRINRVMPACGAGA